MTALPALPELDDLFKPPVLDLMAPPEQPVRPPRKIRAAAMDSIVKDQRASTPPAVAEQRTTKRMSVSELNTSDMGNLMERYQATRYDDRGPITRFLDLLDMPRNLIAGTIFPSIRRRKESEGDIGMGGFGNVRFSDILDEMGVEPGIIRGVAGFVGDVAMDPLTYLGPAGWGAKVVGTGGKSVELLASGRRALNEAVQAAARGRPVADEAAAGLVRALGGDVLAQSAGKTAKQVEGELRDAILGAKTGGKLSRVTEALGADIGTKGSRLADSFFSATRNEASEAARAFVTKHGRGAAPGIRLGVPAGNAGSYLAHIPFTSYGLYVPAFTGAAKEAGVVAARAAAGFSEAAGPLGDDVKRLGALHTEMRTITDDLNGLLDELHEAGDEDGMGGAAIKEAIDALNERRKGLLDQADKIVRGVDPQGLTGGLYEGLGPARPQNAISSIADVVHQEGQLKSLIDQSLEFENQMRDTVTTVNKRRELLGRIAPEVNAKTDEILSQLRTEHEGMYGEGGLFRQEKPVDPRKAPAPTAAPLVDARGGADIGEGTLGHTVVTGPQFQTEAEAKAWMQQHYPEHAHKQAVVRRKSQGKLSYYPQFSIENPERAEQIAFKARYGYDKPAVAATPEAISQYEADLAKWHEIHDFKTPAARAAAKKKAMDAILPNLEEGQRALLNIDPTESDIMEGVADSVQAEMKLRATQAEAIRGTIRETARNTENRMLADTAADMLGLGPSTGGYSAFTPLREITRSIFGDDNTVTQYANRKFDAMDEWVRKNFGLTKGEAGRARRSFEVQRDARAQAAYNNKLNQLQSEVTDILTARGIDPANWEEAHDVTMALAYMQRMKAGENWSTLGSPIPGMLERAKAGPLGAAVNDLNELAKKHVGLLDSMTQDELMLKLLNENAIDGYMMGGATREGAELLQGLGNTPAEQAAKASVRTTQPFQREKSMTRAVWQGPSGDTNAMYRFEYDFYRRMLDENGNLSGVGREMLKAQQALHPDVAGVSEEFWNAVRTKQQIAPEMIARLTPWEKMAYLAGSYDRLPESFRVGHGAFKQVDAFLLNQEFPNRLGVMVPGQTIPRGMFETSFAEQMARRTASHEKAQLATQFNEILGQHGAAIAKQVENQAILKLSQGVDSADIVFVDGSKGRVEKAANGEVVIRAGDQKYRKLRDMGEVQGALNQLGAGVYDPAGLSKYFPEKVAEAYERAATAVSRPHEFIGMYDEFLRVWKTFTLAHPSWIIGDVAGGLIQSLAAGVNPLKFSKSTPTAMKLALAMDKPEVLKTMKVVMGGREMTGEEAVKLLNRYMIPSGSVHGEAFAKLVDGGVYLPEYTQSLMSKKAMKDPVGAVKTRLREIRSRAAMKAKLTLDASKISDPLKGKLRKPLAAYNAVVPEAFVRNFLSPFMALNARANDTMRIASFMALMDDGHDAAGAAAKVLESMFDVSDLTRFETTTMKRLIPFYSWMKHSGVYWTKRLMQNPALANMAPRVKSAIEEGLYGDDAVPDHLRPNWMRDQLALQIGSDPTKRYALTLGTAIPQETALAVGAAATSPIIGAVGLKQMLGQVGFGLALPFKAAMELAAGREAFSGRTIGFSPNEGDLTVGEYLTSQVRPLRELGIGNIREGPIQKALGSGVVSGASRLLLGGRSQPFDEDRVKQNLVRQFKEAEQNIRKRVTIAEREKNPGASTDARATLMRLYETMMQKGLEEEVPAWARMQLEELHAGGG